MQQGFSGHLPDIVEKQFINQNGEQASSDEENANTIHLHFSIIFDRSKVPVDPIVLDEIEPLPMDEEMWTGLESFPDKDEIRKAIKKMKNDKAAGVTGVTPDMLKVRSKAAIDYMPETIRKYWKGELDCEEWHVLKLTMLYKGEGEGESNDPNNWRGIRLKELTSKITSSIVASRVLLALDNNNVDEQFSTTG
jgi:hypothetical protein